MEFIQFQPGQKFAGKDAPTSSKAETFDDAGIVLTKSDLVVDIDAFEGRHDKLVSMLDTLGIKTQTVYTKRGAHLYFKKPGRFKQAGGQTPLGIKVEYKTATNTPNGLTFRRNGKDREMVNEGERQAFPWFLKPMRKAPDMLGLEKGDNRQTTLFSYTGQLAKGHDRDDYLPVLRAINSDIFAEPLDETDFNHATRVPDNDTELVDESDDVAMARVIIDDLHVIRFNGVVYYVPATPQQARLVGARGDWYIQDVDKHNGIVQIVTNDYAADQKAGERWNIYQSVLNLAPAIVEAPDAIRFKNGFLMGRKWAPMTDYQFTPYYIDREYHTAPEAVPAVDKFLDSVSGHNADVVEFLLEMAGYSLLVNPEMKRKLAKVFFIYGPGGNGKSTFLDLLRRALGAKDNTSALSIDDLGDPTKLVNLEGKLANLGDDQPDAPIDQKQSAYLKNVSAGSTISVRKLYQTAHDATITANLIFTTNHVLNIYDSGKAMKRRVQWVPMMGTELENFDDAFWTEFNSESAAAYFLDLIVPAFQRVMERGGFIQVPEMDRVARKLQRDNNSAISFLEDQDFEDLTDKPAGEVFKEYVEDCENDSIRPIPRRIFDQIVEDKFGLIPVRHTDEETGKRARWYRDADHQDEYIADFCKGVELTGKTREEVTKLYDDFRKTNSAAPELTWPDLKSKIVDQTNTEWKRVRIGDKRYVTFVNK